jgi:hypothetical protein
MYRLSYQYLWPCQNIHGGVHLANWNSIDAPKDYGEWELKDILPFAHALARRNLWILS